VGEPSQKDELLRTDERIFRVKRQAGEDRDVRTKYGKRSDYHGELNKILGGPEGRNNYRTGIRKKRGEFRNGGVGSKAGLYQKSSG